MIHEFRNPIPVETPLGEGYVLFVCSNNQWENDEWTVVLDNGEIRHFLTYQIKVVKNDTYGVRDGDN
jgi:hypothetical protein